MTERLHPSDIALGAVVLGIVGYDLNCPKGEMISEGFDRYRATRIGRVATTAGVIFIAGHLLRAWGDQDILSRALSFKDRVGDAMDDAMDCFGDVDGNAERG